MANTIKLRRSATTGAVPTTTQLALGEVAINTYDGKVFIKKDDGTESIVEVGASSSGGRQLLAQLLRGLIQPYLRAGLSVMGQQFLLNTQR